MRRPIPPHFLVEATIRDDAQCSLVRAVDSRNGNGVFVWILDEKDRLDLVALETCRGIHLPHLVPLAEWGNHDGHGFIVQPAADSRPLDPGRRDRTIPLSKILSSAAELAVTLKALHRAAVSLGNLQLSHCVVSRDGRLQILGLGVGTSVGALRYRAPELLHATGSASPAGDVFALGALIFEMAVGLAPFDGAGDSLHRAIAYQPPPRLTSLRPDAPQAMETWIAKCLAKKPEERFATMEEVANQLLGLATTPPSVTPRRLPTWMLVAASTLLLLGGFAIGTGFEPDRNTLGPPRHEQTEHWRTIAIMPLRLASREDENLLSLFQAVEDALVGALNRNTPLSVISTLSTKVYDGSAKDVRQIAEELGADALIEASILRDEAQTLLYLRCVDARTGTYAWEQHVRLDSDDVFRIQDQVEASLYSPFASVWTAQARPLVTRSREAYTLFLEARRLYGETDRGSTDKAIDMLKRAVLLDEDFAPAWAALSRAYSFRLRDSDNPESELALEPAIEAASRAISLAPRAPHGYSARGLAEIIRRFYLGDDSDDAEYWVDEALKRSPDFHDALLDKAFLLSNRGIMAGDTRALRDSLFYFERALGQHPTDTTAIANYATALMIAGEHRESRAQLDRAVENTPDSIRLQTSLSHVAYASADYERAIEATRYLIERDEPSRRVHELRLANYLIAGDRRDEAARIVAKYRNEALHPHFSFLLASTFAGMGDHAETRRLLEDWDRGTPRGSEQRGQYDWWLIHDPNFRSLDNTDLINRFLSSTRS